MWHYHVILRECNDRRISPYEQPEILPLHFVQGQKDSREIRGSLQHPLQRYPSLTRPMRMMLLWVGSSLPTRTYGGSGVPPLTTSAGVAASCLCERSEAISLLTPHDCFVAPLLAKTVMNPRFHPPWCRWQIGVDDSRFRRNRPVINSALERQPPHPPFSKQRGGPERDASSFYRRSSTLLRLSLWRATPAGIFQPVST